MEYGIEFDTLVSCITHERSIYLLTSIPYCDQPLTRLDHFIKTKLNPFSFCSSTNITVRATIRVELKTLSLIILGSFVRRGSET